MTVKQRLLTFITHTGQNVAEFERSCGLSNAYVQNIKQTIMPNKLAQTPCKKDKARRMFLFSCLTGMRYSDCISLAWSQVEDSEDGCRVVFRQQKTKNLEYISINEQARQYMGERSDGLVFGFIYISQLNNDIRAWMKDAGIKKKITFHCARHTFATLLLSLGTDIYVVSRLLGHTDIKTTQIYAHILDEQKREAVERIPEL